MSFKSQKLQSAPNGEVFSVVFQVQLGCEEIKRLLAETDPRVHSVLPAPPAVGFSVGSLCDCLLQAAGSESQNGSLDRRCGVMICRHVSWVPATASMASQEATSISVKARIDHWHQKPQFCSLAGGQAGQLDPCPSAMLS